MTKIDIISGFLGAGKTTLIKKLLKEGLKNEKVVLIENEFGEIGVDGAFLEEAGIEIKEMNSGCICCSLVGDFSKSLEMVCNEYQPQRILIEPSGVGKLSDVVKAVSDVQEKLGLSINSLTCVADAKKVKMYMKNFGEFFNNQIEHATTIVLSRTQLLSEDKLLDVTSRIKEHNANASIITTPWDELDGSDILAVMEKSDDLEKQMMEESKHHHHHHDHHDHDHECCCGHDHHHEHDHDHECCCGHDHHHEHDHDHECCCGDDHQHEHDHDHECCCGHDHHDHHHHHADEVFTSLGWETSKRYSKDELEVILKALSNEEEYGFILRAKGMLQAQNTWHYFDFVPEEYEIREGKACYSGRICVIGSNMKEDAIKALFKMV